MTINNVSEFIDKIYDLTDLDCVYDGGDIELHDEITMLFEGAVDIGINVSSDFKRFSIYRPFSYYDFSANDVKKGYYYPEELEAEKRTFLTEGLFTLWSQKQEKQHAIEVWSDGFDGMCPGYVSWVGYRDIEYSDEAVKEFMHLSETFEEIYAKSSMFDMQINIVALLCERYGVNVTPSNTVQLEHESVLSINEYCKNVEANISSYYVGKDYCFFKRENKIYVTRNNPVKLFFDVFEKCEMYDEVRAFCTEEKIVLYSEHIKLELPMIEDNGIYSRVEENEFLIKAKMFSDFASNRFKEVFSSHFAELIDEDMQYNVVIVTEGITDYIHLKKHWDAMKMLYKKCRPYFWNHEMPGKKYGKQSMGGSELLKMCMQYSKIPQDKKIIFIADSDDRKVADEMSGDEGRGYKSWGNNVFSFTIPTPQYRKQVNGICIEHLYTDEEIKKMYMCEDGVERRLFLGNEFDEFGRNAREQLLCTKAIFCGTGSNKIIDGTSDARVISYNCADNTNYALSKMEFAKRVSVQFGTSSFEAFKEVFEMIHKIVLR